MRVGDREETQKKRDIGQESDRLLRVPTVLPEPLWTLRTGTADDGAVVRDARVFGEVAVNRLVASRLLLGLERLNVVLARLVALRAVTQCTGVSTDEEYAQGRNERTSGTHFDEFHGLHFGSLYIRSTFSSESPADSYKKKKTIAAPAKMQPAKT